MPSPVVVDFSELQGSPKSIVRPARSLMPPCVREVARTKAVDKGTKDRERLEAKGAKEKERQLAQVTKAAEKAQSAELRGVEKAEKEKLRAVDRSAQYMARVRENSVNISRAGLQKQADAEIREMKK